jgi:hypothetical protein
MKKFLTFLAVILIMTSNSFATVNVNTTLTTKNQNEQLNIKKYLVEQYHYVFQLDCGGVVWVNANYQMSVSQLGILQYSFSRALCDQAPQTVE